MGQLLKDRKRRNEDKMRVEHYFCDQCNKEVEQKELQNIHATTIIPYNYGYGGTKKILFIKDLCIECRKKLGVYIDPATEEKEFVEEAKSIETRLFEIISEIVYMNQPNRTQ